ncbi:DUF3667 domain-containing protein [Spongiimicrobium salis]|uniref:DUF3667 domain-containing protein n=1 Tax=Spongiimicrobium salis TaxID=1667022 RepID=UPI00374D44F0
MTKTTSCKNCERLFDASFDYCPHCGQEVADKLTFGILFSNTISNYFSIDARFFRSFVPLMLKPGVLARRFVDGKRLSYLHPAQFYLFISVVFFFLFSFSVRKADNKVSDALKKGFQKETILDSLQVQKDSVQIAKTKKIILDNIEGLPDEELQRLDSVISQEQGAPNVSFTFNRNVLDSLILHNASEADKLAAMGMENDAGALTKRFYTQMLKFYEQRGGGILKALYDTIPIAMFFMLPLFAFLLKIFYWKRGIFAHHMVFSFYFFTFLFTTFCLLLLLDYIITLVNWITTLFFLFCMVYLIIALINFYKSRWWGAMLKAGTIMMIYMLVVLPIAIFGIMAVSFLLY